MKIVVNVFPVLQVYLIDVQFMEATNHATVARVLMGALESIYPNKDFSRVVLLLTDSAAYMLKMGRGVASMLPNCVHVTCMAHAVHRVAESIRLHFTEVDRLISNGKKVFCKAPRRRSLFKELHPNVELPPEPVTTRWGTWLSAVIYYTENFDAVEDVTNKLDIHDAASIDVLQTVLKSQQVKNDLAFITAHFRVLLNALDILEKRNARVKDHWEAVTSVHEAAQVMPHLKLKWDAVLSRNGGLKMLLPVLKTLYPTLPLLGLQETPEYLESLPPAARACFEHAPLTSVDVERSFSQYKAILRANRESFTVENLRRYVLLHCNSKYL